MAPAVGTLESNKLFLGQFSSFAGDVVATMLGAFAGAYAAFALENRRHRSAENSRRAAAVNLAILTLSRMYNSVAQYRREIIEPARASSALWYELRPADLHNGSPLTFDYPALQFLFASSNPDVVNYLALEERRFASLVELVSRRSSLHVDQLQPRVEASGARGSVPITVIEGAAGPRLVQMLRDLTNTIVEHADRNVDSHAEIAGILRQAALPLVRKELLVTFRPQEADVSDKLAKNGTRPGWME